MMTKKIDHLGVIMDGNRRFSKRLMLKPHKGHEWGAKKVEDLYFWCKDQGINELTLYTLSIENMKRRPKEELDFLMALFRKEFEAVKNGKKFKNEDIKIRFIGRREMLPNDIQTVMKELEEKTKNNSSFTMNFAMAYGGQSEIVDAVKCILKEFAKHKIKPEEIDETSFKNYLYISSEPDLIIRTGGDVRTSNFLPFQTAYSEWYFTETLWPELKKEDFYLAIEKFQSRQRRFGK